MVLAVAADEDVAVRAAENEIVARVAEQDIRAAAALDLVVAGATVDDRLYFDGGRDFDLVVAGKALDVDRVDGCGVERADLFVAGLDDDLLMGTEADIDVVGVAAAGDVEFVAVEVGVHGGRTRCVGRDLTEQAVAEGEAPESIDRDRDQIRRTLCSRLPFWFRILPLFGCPHTIQPKVSCCCHSPSRSAERGSFCGSDIVRGRMRNHRHRVESTPQSGLHSSGLLIVKREER